MKLRTQNMFSFFIKCQPMLKIIVEEQEILEIYIPYFSSKNFTDFNGQNETGKLTSSRDKSLTTELESFCGSGVTVPTSIKPKPLFRKPFIASASKKKKIKAKDS